MVIYDGEVALQLILDEPPEALWIHERCEFYKRLEQRDEMRDVLPMLPDTPAQNRIRLSGPASDAIWKVIYSNPEVDALLERLAAKGPQALRATKRWLNELDGSGDESRARHAAEASASAAEGDEFAALLRTFWAARKSVPG